MWEYHFSHWIASKGKRPKLYATFITFLSFMASHSQCKNPDDHPSCGICHTHIFIFYNGLRFPLFCAPCHTGWVQKYIPTLDTMYPCVNNREGECYAQLCLPWIPTNPFLLIPMPPISLYFSDVRFTTWTYPSLSLADIWFNACCIISHAALRYTYILIILK